uniref:Short neuropeptide F n=2 Tax=Rhodnius prolixus TaxID=13249 RepID=SNPF_RHOPR|nr:RecName: Full=Short neuropeptide F; Short=Rhopr-SNF [Rhodnius prolixus]
NNRSPQLRLRF